MSTLINDGGAAYPHSQEAHDFGITGMSLRDWFAGQVLAAVLMPTLEAARQERSSREKAIQVAVELSLDSADAMLAARNNQPKEP